MKYRDLLTMLSQENYNAPVPSGDVSDEQRAKRHRCMYCSGEMKYVIAITAPSHPQHNYRGFLVCRNCSEVVETHEYDW
jgi:uncharacterized protein with PIN domain